jgi:hypothetical protein
MSKQKQSMALQATSNVSEFLVALDSQIADLKKVQETPYKTNGRITRGNGSVLDIKECKDIAELVGAYSGILFRSKAFEEAYSDLGIDKYPAIKIEGYTPEEWKSDILLRKSVIEYQDKYNTLTQMKKEWEDLMDKEDKKALLFSKMEKVLGTGGVKQVTEGDATDAVVVD